MRACAIGSVAQARIPDDADEAEEEDEEEDFDQYIWAIDHLDSEEEDGPILVLEKGHSVTQEDAAETLEEAYLDGGGVCITKPRFPASRLPRWW